MNHIVLSKEFGERSLILGASSGEYKSLAELIQAGVDVHAQDDMALWNAVDANYFLGAQLLIDLGADVNAANGRALVTAARHGNKDMIDLLIRSGARVDAQNYSALKLAAYHVASGNSGAFERLLAAAIEENAAVSAPIAEMNPEPQQC